ncbi:MAG TPA: hypothetical protein VGM89_17785, partial [Puia sp.]
MKNLLFVLLLLGSGVVMAQERGSLYLIRAGKLFDSETGEFKTGMVILVKEQKIEAVRPEREVSEAERA